jgi:hypothetical protein
MIDLHTFISCLPKNDFFIHGFKRQLAKKDQTGQQKKSTDWIKYRFALTYTHRYIEVKDFMQPIYPTQVKSISTMLVLEPSMLV